MAETLDTTSAEPKKGKFPSSIPYIIGNEAAERFNYYGLRAILTTFMIAQFYNRSGSSDPAVIQLQRLLPTLKPTISWP